MILPDSLKNVLALFAEVFETWASEQLYTQFVTSHRHHLLVKLNERLDLSGMEAACGGYYHGSGPGKPVHHGVKRLVRAVLVRYLYGYSLRETEQAINANLFIKWYVGYGVFERGPDHSTLEDFELWLLCKQKRLLFDEVLRQVDQTFPAERTKAQVGDTYAMEANAAIENLTPRLRHASQQLLEAYRNSGLLDSQNVLSGYNWLALFGPPNEADEGFLEKCKRQARLQSTVLAVLDLIQRIEGGLRGFSIQQHPEVRRWVACLHKIIADECRMEAQSVVELPNKDKGDFRIISASDPEASFRMHGEEAEDITLGYNVQVAATVSGFVRETQAYTGAVPDQVGVAALVAEQVEHLGCCPPKLIYDMAGGHGKTRAEVEQASRGKTQIVAKLPPYDVRTRFGPYDFTLSEDGISLTCPNGKVSTIAYNSQSGDGRDFRFFACQCWQGEIPTQWRKADLSKRCPLWEQCRDARQGPGGMRQVFISDYRQQVLDAQIHNQTQAFKQDMKLRPRIERIIFELTHYNGARRCQRHGLAAADFQAKMASTAYNLKLWMRKLDNPTRQRRAWQVPAAAG